MDIRRRGARTGQTRHRPHNVRWRDCNTQLIRAMIIRDDHFLIALFIYLSIFTAQSDETIKHIGLKEVTNWALVLENELQNLGEFVTRRNKAEQEFAGAPLEKRNDAQIAREISENIKSMMRMKEAAVMRIMEIAENVSEESKDEEVKGAFQYYNAKCLVPQEAGSDAEELCNQTLQADLTPNPNFWNIPINTSFSVVHVPTNVYDRDREVIKPIKWSQELDKTFIDNYKNDPTLRWQYFGSSTGFMRQFPAMEWKQNPVDLYDCRTRPWFTEAAASPKDMVILLDHSGSMTGLRKEIARQVVGDILDTLGNNDYVNILKFSEHVTEVVDCFKDRLVQANLANIRVFKEHLMNIETKNTADFSLAIEKAFELLYKYRDFEALDDPHGGANCNQAIMLVTDGVAEMNETLFKIYNWDNDFPVRVFTYLVGREVGEVRDIKWIACANIGFYVHISTQAEVREKVLQYIPVMARPLVLNKTVHPVIWTPVYADVTDPKMTDYIWERKEFAVQKRLLQNFELVLPERVQLAEYVERLKVEQEVEDKSNQEYTLMTSVAVPVFDKRDYAMVYIRENVETLKEVPVKTRIASLLGVAGTDVPISEIKKLLNPFKLGVGSYAFLVTNNGYILCHPDLRASFQGILKPNYNSVDMLEVEIADDAREPREFDQFLLRLREDVVMQAKPGKSEAVRIKYHLDDLRRLGIMRKVYHYVPIEDSPFTVVVAVPHDYGDHRVKGQEELKRLVITGKDMVPWFEGRLWRIHPDWVYCSYVNESYHDFSNPQEELCHFLRKATRPGWKWQTAKDHHHNPTTSSGKASRLEKDAYYCDRDLLLSLLYDAKATEWFMKNIPGNDTVNLEQMKERFGITVTFIATRSGFTRWQDFAPSNDKSGTEEFGDIYPRAIDETWYRRAVDHHYVEPNSYVYSVPFQASNRNDTLVTVSHAIFVKKGSNSAPVAVVGYQFQLEALRTLFFNVTSVCPKPEERNCSLCTSDDLDCYVLDNNGYVIVSENILHSGKFFGELDNNVMFHLEQAGIYRRYRFYDYQAVCFELRNGNGIAGGCNIKSNNFFHLFLHWMVTNILWLAAQLGFAHSDMQMNPTSDFILNEDMQEDDLEQGDEGFFYPNRTIEHRVFPFDERKPINKTRLESCDQEMSLFILQYRAFRNLSYDTPSSACERPYVVKKLKKSNLILVVVNKLCAPCREKCYISAAPREVNSYNNTLICHKYQSNNLPRRRPLFCIKNDTREAEIEMCGRSSKLLTSSSLLLLLTLIRQFLN